MLPGRRLEFTPFAVSQQRHNNNGTKETFAKFCFATLRIRPEVVLALQGIKAWSEGTSAKGVFNDL